MSVNLSLTWASFGRISVNLTPGDLGVDRLEGALDVVGDVVLGVPEVEVARPALEVEHDDALGLAPARAAAVSTHRSRGRPAASEQPAERRPEQRRAADAEHVAASHAAIAQVRTGMAGDDDHGRLLGDRSDALSDGYSMRESIHRFARCISASSRETDIIQ